MAPRKPCPKGYCRQCWNHAYDSAIHRRLKGRDCQPCLSHMGGKCPPDQIQK